MQPYWRKFLCSTRYTIRQFLSYRVLKVESINSITMPYQSASPFGDDESSKMPQTQYRPLSLHGSIVLWTLAAFSVGKTPLTGDQPVDKPLPTHRTTQTQNKRKQTYMPRVGFEPTTPVFQRAKSVHFLDRAFTVIGFIA
jgi:hypothetical protein